MREPEENCDRLRMTHASWWALFFLSLRIFLFLSALLLALLTTMPRWCVLPLALVGVISLVFASACTQRQIFLGKLTVLGAWVSTSLLFAGLVWASRAIFIFDPYYAVVAFLIAAVIGSRTHSTPADCFAWRLLASVWALFGAFVWLAAAYIQDFAPSFFLGLASTLALLLLYKRLFRMPRVVILAINSLVLLIIFLPLTDLLMRPKLRPLLDPESAGKGYCYDVVKNDPHAFRHWWGRFITEMERLSRDCYVPDPDHRLAFRLKPNSETRLFQSRISINSKGFRGKEIATEKGDAYRIVALGESTTFGLTLTPGHRPWPELLETSVREKLELGRPVEVINAGVPVYSLQDSLARFASDILPLKPDMIISYHGWNGFRLFAESLSPSVGAHLPTFKHRPLGLLAECEYRIKVLSCRRRLIRELVAPARTSTNLMATQYAALYDELVRLAETNHIRLVLANFSMAVNSQSNPAVVEFYREVFPAIYWQLKANSLHSEIVARTAGRHSEVVFVDSHPNLDGKYEKFIDVIHFAPEGDQQLADTFFASISQLLRREINGPGPAVSN